MRIRFLTLFDNSIGIVAMSARKLDALLRNYEHTHVIDELRSWLDENSTERKHLINDANNRLFKFKMTQTTRSQPLPPRDNKSNYSRTVSVDCLVIDQSALEHKYLPNALQTTFEKGLDEKFDRLYNFVDKDTWKPVQRKELPKGDKITTRIAELPDTLFMSVNRMTEEGALDTRGLQCPKVIDFKWDGYKALLYPDVQPRRYTLVGAIVGRSKSGKQAISKNLVFQALAIVRCAHGVWYSVDTAEGLREPTYHGTLMDSAEVGKLLHPDGMVDGVGADRMTRLVAGEASDSQEKHSTFVMRLYYRCLEAVLPPPPFKQEADMAFYPDSFISLFDRGPHTRDAAMGSVVARATEDVADNQCMGMIELMQHMPPLDEPVFETTTMNLSIGVGPGNKTPEALLVLFDTRPDVLIGRTVFEVFRVRSLLAVFKRFYAHAALVGHDESTSKAILTWAVKEWKTLSGEAKQGWILVADYFNVLFSDRMALEIECADRKRGPRLSAFNLFVEQWPVLIGKKLACDTTEDADDAHPAGWFNADRDQDVTLLVDDKAAIARIAGNQETMNDIWHEMDPSAKTTFAELARWRNDTIISFDQGTYEVWERLPFHGAGRNQVSDDAATASVLRLDLVSKAKVDKDPRALRLKELKATSGAKAKTLPNAHVQLAMVEEACNPYVHYSSDNFALEVDTRSARFPKSDPQSTEWAPVQQTVRGTSIDVDPFVDVDFERNRLYTATSLEKLLDVQASHVNLGWEEKFGTARSHRVVNTPDTVAIRVTPWTQTLVRNKHEVYAKLGVNYELTPTGHRENGCLVEVSFPKAIDLRTFEGYRSDGTKCPYTHPELYELVGIVSIQRPKPPKTELVADLPARGKIGRSDWNALGSGKDQTVSLVTDTQREDVYKLVAAWGKEDAAGNPPPAHQRLHVSSSQLDAMLRAATGVLRLSLGRVKEDRGETMEQAVQECVERTMINLFALREHYISQELWKKLFDIVNGQAPCPPDAINKQLCTVMKQLREPTDREWRVAKELRQAPVGQSEAVYLITKYLGQGTAFLGSAAAINTLPVDAVCKADSEDETPIACMIPPAKRTRFWHRIERLAGGWSHYESGDTTQQKVDDLPETLRAGLDGEMNEHSVVFYYRRAENWKREADFVERLITYDRGYTQDMIEQQWPGGRHPERSLRLMGQSPFLRRELYNVAVDSIRAAGAQRILLQFMGWLTFPFGQEQETAMRMIFDRNVKQETYDSFITSKAFSKKGLAGFYVKANKSKKASTLVSDGSNGEGSAPEPTPEEAARLAAEEAERAARERAAAEEARARTAALEAERVERERVAAEEAAAREAAIRERLAADAAERAVRAAEEAEAAREARLARQARDAAQQEARDAARRTKESDEQAKKKALAKQRSEEKKAAKAANNARKKGPSAIKLEDERKKKHSEEVATQEAEAKAAAKAAEAKVAAKRAARAAAAAPLQAEAEARTAAAEARAAARAAERAAERAAILEADELAEQTEFDRAEEWAAEQATEEAPPLSPMSTSTAASTAPSSAWTHGASDVDAQCVICFEGVRDHLCLPCKHLCVCARCVSGSSLTTCPMCRQPVEEIINIFW